MIALSQDFGQEKKAEKEGRGITNGGGGGGGVHACLVGGKTQGTR